MARSKAAGRAKKHPQNNKNNVLCSVCGKGDGKYKCPKCRLPFCCVQCSKDHKANHCPANKTASNNDGSEDATKQQCAGITAATADSNTESESKYLPVGVLKQQSASRPKKRIRRSSNNNESDDDDQPGWNITDEMKQLIQRSDWLRKELNDGGLRHLIGEIDAASDVEEEEDEADNGSNNFYKRRKNNWGMKDHNNKNGNAVDDISPRVLALARTKHSHPKFAAFMDKLLLTAGVLTDGTGGGEEGEGCGRLELVPVPRRGGEIIATAATNTGNQESQSEEEDDSASDSNEEDGGGSSDEDDSEE